jgi:hypothetical protein
MGMFDDVKCEYPLPDNKHNTKDFQTKSFGDGFVGGFMDNYTITKEGKLIFHKCSYEAVPEEERPYYGTPEWDNNPILQICGMMKPVDEENVEQEHHGVINIYSSIGDIWYEYNIKFTDGVVESVERVYREFG